MKQKRKFEVGGFDYWGHFVEQGYYSFNLLYNGEGWIDRRLDKIHRWAKKKGMTYDD